MKRNINLLKRSEREDDIEITLPIDSNLNNLDVRNQIKAPQKNPTNTFDNSVRNNPSPFVKNVNNINDFLKTKTTNDSFFKIKEKRKIQNTYIGVCDLSLLKKEEKEKSKLLYESENFENSLEFERRKLMKIKESFNPKTQLSNKTLASKKGKEAVLKYKSNNQFKKKIDFSKLFKKKFIKNNRSEFKPNPFLDENTTLLDLHQNKIQEEKNFLQKDLEFLQKKTTRPIIKDVKCFKCRRPFTRSSNEEWKKLCIYCYLKKTGHLVDCAECFKQMFIFPYQLGSEYKCQECHLKLKGVKSTCSNFFCSKKTYYRKPENAHLISSCEDCYLRSHGAKLKCKDCKKDIFVYKEQKTWKTRCYDCWIKWD